MTHLLGSNLILDANYLCCTMLTKALLTLQLYMLLRNTYFYLFWILPPVFLYGKERQITIRHKS